MGRIASKTSGVTDWCYPGGGEYREELFVIIVYPLGGPHAHGKYGDCVLQPNKV